MGNSGWTVDPNSITLPPGAGPSDPRIVIGPDDPIALLTGSEAAIVFYFGEQRAFIISVEQSGGTPDYGQLHIWTYDEINGIQQQIDLDNDVLNNMRKIFLGLSTPQEMYIAATTLFLQSPTTCSEDFTIDRTKSIADDNNQQYFKGQRGTQLISFVALSQSTANVTYPTALPAGVVPDVDVNIDSGAAATGGWVARAINKTNTGFTIFVFTTRSDPAAAVFTPIVATWTNIPVSWVATTPG